MDSHDETPSRGTQPAHNATRVTPGSAEQKPTTSVVCPVKRCTLISPDSASTTHATTFAACTSKPTQVRTLITVGSCNEPDRASRTRQARRPPAEPNPPADPPQHQPPASTATPPYDGAGDNWTRRHRDRLGKVTLSERGAQATLLDYLGAIDALTIRRGTVEAAISELVGSSPWAEEVARLRCMRGIDTLTAVGLCAEIGDFGRFERPAQLMSL